MGNKVVDQVAVGGDVGETVSRLPDELQLALSDIAESAREGLLALAADVQFSGPSPVPRQRVKGMSQSRAD